MLGSLEDEVPAKMGEADQGLPSEAPALSHRRSTRFVSQAGTSSEYSGRQSTWRGGGSTRSRKFRGGKFRRKVRGQDRWNMCAASIVGRRDRSPHHANRALGRTRMY